MILRFQYMFPAYIPCPGGFYGTPEERESPVDPIPFATKCLELLKDFLYRKCSISKQRWGASAQVSGGQTSTQCHKVGPHFNLYYRAPFQLCMSLIVPSSAEGVTLYMRILCHFLSNKSFQPIKTFKSFEGAPILPLRFTRGCQWLLLQGY